MFRKIFLLSLFVLLVNGTALAAPVTDLAVGKAQAGYTYQNFDIKLTGGGYTLDAGSTHGDNLYLQYAASPKLTLGVETINGSKTWASAPYALSLDSTMTDVYLQYGLDPANRIRAMVGDRNYDTSASYTDGYTYIPAEETTNKFFGGLAAYAPLDKTTSVYATYKKSSLADDWELGLQYNATKDLTAVLQYRWYKEDEGDGVDLKLDGVGVGVAWKF